MANGIGRLWAGKLYGTNTGNLSAEFNNREDGSGFDGLIRFMDDRFGPVVYAVKGTYDGTTLKFVGEATQQPENVVTADVEGQAQLTSEGSLRGTWSSKLGTGGTFVLLPHDIAERVENSPAVPEQLHTAERQLGAIRLYPDDVKEIISAIRKDFSVGRVIVNYRDNGSEKSKYASDFEKEFGRLKELRYLRLHIQEPEQAHGLSRIATIELNAAGSNTVRVQGIQESWVIGKAESLTSELRKYQKFFPTTFQRLGLNINTLIAVGALVALPELSLGRRIVFVLAVAAVLYVNTTIHQRYIPNALIYLSAPEPSGLARAVPQIGSTILAAISTLVTGVLFMLLKGELKLPVWITSLFTSA